MGRLKVTSACPSGRLCSRLPMKASRGVPPARMNSSYASWQKTRTLEKKTIPAGSVCWKRTRRRCSNTAALAPGPRGVIHGVVDALRLPVVTSAARALDAASLGLKATGDARARGLFDCFGRSHTYLRISVIEKCNLRCRYCMPEEGVALLPKDELLSFEEIERLAALFVRLGVRKIRVTGGEPLVRRGVDELIGRLGALKACGLQRLAMTSNALLLRQHLEGLRAGGLDAVNLSLDTLRPDRFRSITLRDGCEETIAAIRAAASAGFDAVKVNAVVMAGVNDDELVDLALAFALRDSIEVRYIEYMPFEGNHWGERLRMFPAESIAAR